MRLRDRSFSRGAGRLIGLVLAALAACCVAASSAGAAELINTIPVVSEPLGVSSDGTHVWVTNFYEDRVREIEAASGKVIKTIPTACCYPDSVSSDGTHVWVAEEKNYSVTEIEAVSGAVIKTITVGILNSAVSSDGTHVWVASWGVGGANNGERTVSEIDAASGEVIKEEIHVGIEPDAVSSDGTHVWVANYGENTVTEINAASGTVISTIPVGEKPRGVSSDGTHVWVTNGGDHTVTEIGARSGQVIATIQDVGFEPYGVSSDGTHVWVSNAGENTVTEIEAASGKVIENVPVGSEPLGVSSDGTHVWDANFEGDTVSEILIANRPSCTTNTGTVKLSPGLSATAAVQTMKIKGTLAGCSGEPFTETKYTATLKTVGPVSCSVLKAAGATATGAAKYKLAPKAKASKGTLSMLLTETSGVALSGEVTSGSYSPLTLSGTVTETYAGGATCGAKPVKKGTFSGSAVNFE